MALQERHKSSILDATKLECECMQWRSRSAMRAAYWMLLHAMALRERYESSILDTTKLECMQ